MQQQRQHLAPALGNTWRHAVNTRVELQLQGDHDMGGLDARTGLRVHVGRGAMWRGDGGAAFGGAAAFQTPVRVAHVTKSPLCGLVRACYRVGPAGVEAARPSELDAEAGAGTAAKAGFRGVVAAMPPPPPVPPPVQQQQQPPPQHQQCGRGNGVGNDFARAVLGGS